jgi:hypothetical protein
MKLLLSVVAVDIAIAVKIGNVHCILRIFCKGAISEEIEKFSYLVVGKFGLRIAAHCFEFYTVVFFHG